MGEITAIFIVGIVTWGIYRLFELFARRKERMAIIDKLGEKIGAAKLIDVEEVLNLPLFKKPDNSSWALKISLLMIGIGLGAIIAFFIQYGMIGDLLTQSHDDWEIRNNLNGFKESIYFACIAVFGGIGLLTAYLIEMKNSKK